MKYSFWKVLSSQWSIKNESVSFIIILICQLIVSLITCLMGTASIPAFFWLLFVGFCISYGIYQLVKFIVFSLMYLLVTYMANQGDQKAIDLYKESLTWRK